MFNTIYSTNIQGFWGVSPNITWNCFEIIFHCILLHFYIAKYNLKVVKKFFRDTMNIIFKTEKLTLWNNVEF